MTIALNAQEIPPTTDPFIEKSRADLKAAGMTRKATPEGAVYWTGGKGKETLLLLHGVNDQAGTWHAVVPALSKQFRIVAPDLAGHGESEPKSGTLTFATMLEQIEQILALEKADKVIIAGNSMGGWLAMLYALEHPERVSRLVLEDASGMAWDMTGVPLQPKTREETAAMMRAVHGPDVVLSDAILDAVLARRNQPMSRIVLPDVLKHLVDMRLKDLKVPVSLVWGEHDGILSLAYARTLHERIPGSTLSIIKGAAHIPHRQRPAEFVKCLTATC